MPRGAAGQHKWKLYVRLLSVPVDFSRGSQVNASEFIEKVEVHLHSTFVPNMVELTSEPFEVERVRPLLIPQSPPSPNSPRSGAGHPFCLFYLCPPQIGWSTFGVRIKIHFRPQYQKSPMEIIHGLSFAGPDTHSMYSIQFQPTR